MLVGVGSALFTIVSAYGWTDFIFSQADGVIFDPTRIAAQIVTGDRLPRRRRDHPPGPLDPRAHDGGRALGRGRDRHGRRRRATTGRASSRTVLVLVGLGPARLLEGAPVLRDLRRQGRVLEAHLDARADPIGARPRRAPRPRAPREPRRDRGRGGATAASGSRSTCRSGTRAPRSSRRLARLDGGSLRPLHEMRLVLVSENPHKARELGDALPGLGGRAVGRAASCPPGDGRDLPGERARRRRASAARTARRTPGSPGRTRASRWTALGGAPGIYSARYAGDGATDEANVAKLLAELDGVDGRGAAATWRRSSPSPRTGARSWPTGRSRGRVATAPRGTCGFGYDPVFVPEGESRDRRRARGRVEGRAKPPRPGRAGAGRAIRRAKRANGVDSARCSSPPTRRSSCSARPRSSPTSRSPSSSTSRR